MKCSKCGNASIKKGRAMDGRRAYRCPCCGSVWTNGTNGREKIYSQQREGYQFADSKRKP